MAKHVGKKFTWVIKNFSSLQSEKRIYSVPVMIGDYKWRLCAYPKGYKRVDYFSLFLESVDYESLPSLPSGWSRNVKYRLTVLPQLRKKCRVERVLIFYLMAKHVGKKFSWVIENFSSLQSEVRSVPVLIGDCKWHLRANPKGKNVDYLYLCLSLAVADIESLPSGWRRYVHFWLTIVKPNGDRIPVRREAHCLFENMSSSWGFPSMIHLTNLHDKDGGFLVNGEVMIVAEVDVFEVIGTSDASLKSNDSSLPLEKKMLKNDCGESNNSLKEASSVEGSMNVNGFQVLSSQVESVIRIFERHPNIAVDFCAKNQHLRTTCMNFLLSLIETLCKSIQELSNDDLVDAGIALTCLKDVSFKVDWLEKKLDQVKEKKNKEQSVVAQLQETEENILKLKRMFSELEAELLATRTALSFDDVV